MTVNALDLANAVRALSMDAVEAACSGHPGLPMGMADVATELFTNHLKFDAADPHWADRDRFVLSAGHGSMLIYALLHLTGHARPTMDDIRAFRQVGSPCAGHPENFELAGIECTTGPLGQGLAMAVGMAVAERHLNATFGDDLVDHRTWVIAGDGCLMEGVNHEAVGLAGHLKLGRLNVLWDDNRITIDGAVSLSSSEDIPARYAASGWHVAHCDGHDEASIRAAIEEAKADPRPSLIRCRTIIGKGAPGKEGTSAVHGAALGPDIVEKTRAAMGWPHAAFVVPDDIYEGWAAAGRRGAGARADWQARLESHAERAEFERRMAGTLPDMDGALDALPVKTMASRKASEEVLNLLSAAMPELLGGSADLTGSNNTKAKGQRPLTAKDYSGDYIYYGIREFGMAAAMNGMALHGGVIPYGGTFLIFSDYARPAIRLSALQRARVIYVLTHDSIGLGEDGPTHQPIEQLTSLRLIPNLNVYRPCDVVETAECWRAALERTDGPSVLALSRQNLAAVREAGPDNLSAKGAYRIRDAVGPRRVILIATGSEVELALGVGGRLEAAGVGADVVSMPCWEAFDAQPQSYRDDVLPPVDPSQVLRVSIEAGTTLGWERYTMVQGLRFGVDGFGVSGPAEDVYRHFGLTVEAIAEKVVAALEG